MPAATVQARAETQPVASDNADAADDPAIWRNKVDPQASLVVALDLHKRGLKLRVRRQWRELAQLVQVFDPPFTDTAGD